MSCALICLYAAHFSFSQTRIEAAISVLERAMSTIATTGSAPPISSDDVACGTSPATASPTAAPASLWGAGDCATTAHEGHHTHRSHEGEIREEQQTSLPDIHLRSGGQILASSLGRPDKATEKKIGLPKFGNAKAASTRTHAAGAGETQNTLVLCHRAPSRKRWEMGRKNENAHLQL